MALSLESLPRLTRHSSPSLHLAKRRISVLPFHPPRGPSLLPVQAGGKSGKSLWKSDGEIFATQDELPSRLGFSSSAKPPVCPTEGYPEPISIGSSRQDHHAYFHAHKRFPSARNPPRLSSMYTYTIGYIPSFATMSGLSGGRLRRPATLSVLEVLKRSTQHPSTHADEGSARGI